VSDLLTYSELALAVEEAEATRRTEETKMKWIAALREKTLSAIKEILPKDRKWEIELGGEVYVGSPYGPSMRGLEAVVDGLTFAFGEGTWSGERVAHVFLGTTCPECGRKQWSEVQKIPDIARIVRAQAEVCYSCREIKAQATRPASDWAFHASDNTSGLWLGIDWDGSIKTGKDPKWDTSATS
jgi:hypothetical protein